MPVGYDSDDVYNCKVHVLTCVLPPPPAGAQTEASLWGSEPPETGRPRAVGWGGEAAVARYPGAKGSSQAQKVTKAQFWIPAI